MTDPLYIYTITHSTKDLGDLYAVRRHLILPGKVEADKEFLIADKSLEVLRSYLKSRGLYCLGRETSDDEVIIESWV